MSNLKARITFPNLDAQFKPGVEKEIKKKLVRSIPKILLAIKSRMGVEVSRALKNSDVYMEIIGGGDLLGQLGIPNPSDLNDIIDVWADGIEVAYSPSRGKFGVIKIGILESTYSDVLSLPQSSYISGGALSNKRGGPFVIEWLRWLLLEAGRPLIEDYQIFNEDRRASRTTGRIMIPGGNWNMPQRFSAGGDNFAIRALSDIEKVIDDIVRQEITKGIK